MTTRADKRRSRAGIAALVLVAAASALLIQMPGANQDAHLALVKSLSDGTPRIDRYRNETGDTAYIDGHYYAAKAPGLALFTLPWYLALDSTGLAVAKGPSPKPWPKAQEEMSRTAVWEVGLFGATLPALVLLFLLRGVVERIVPGYGTAAALAVGGGTLLAVLGTFFFAHTLAACLGFGAFALLLRERSARASLRLVAAAGLVAGLAVVVEFPLAIVAAALGAYALLRVDRWRRAAAYAGGVAAGLVPLIAFNTWAFGSPMTLSYTNAVVDPGTSGHEVLGANAKGFFGVGTPSPRALLELLFSAKGLLVLAPVCALAGFGLVALWHRGRKAESVLVCGLATAFLVYNAAYYQPFGGFPPGPRFLVPLLPFLALPIAAAWRALPSTATALALASLTVTWVALVAEPLAGSEDAGTWFHRLGTGDVTRTVFYWAWSDAGVLEVLPVLALVGGAVALALLVTPLRIDAGGALLALAAVAAWRIVYVSAPIMLSVDRNEGGWQGAAATTGLVLAIPMSLVLLARGRLAALAPALALAPLVVPRFAAHTTVSLVAVALSLVGHLVVAGFGRAAPAPAAAGAASVQQVRRTL